PMESALRLYADFSSRPPSERQEFVLSEEQEDVLGEYEAWRDIIQAYANQSLIFGLTIIRPDEFSTLGMAGGTVHDDAFLSTYNYNVYTIKDEGIERYRTTYDLRDAPEPGDPEAARRYSDQRKFEAQVAAMEGKNGRLIDGLASYGVYRGLDAVDEALEILE